MEDAAALLRPRGEFAPLTLLLGDIVVRLLTYAEHLDFLLSVRDTRLATMLQFYRDIGWWLVLVGAALWLAYEYRRQKDQANPAGSIGALVFSSSLVAFLIGVVMAVAATGTLPVVIQAYTGDTAADTCTATIDTSRLVGFADDYRLILICGVTDPSIDPQEDARIAISTKFHINGGVVAITMPLGAVKEVYKTFPTPPPISGMGIGFMLWHCVAVIPQDSDSTTIKRVSDIHRINGRILTDPVGGYGNTVILAVPAKSPTAPLPSVGKSANSKPKS